MGSLYKRTFKTPDGEIHERPTWWLKYHQNGRAIRESTGTTKETVARRMLRLREGDVERGIPVTPRLGRLTFEEAAADIQNEYRVNGRRSFGELERRIRLHLAPAFGRRRMATITPAHVRTFIDRRQQAGASNGEINRELSMLRRMFTLAVQGEKLHHRPYIPMLQENNVRTGFFEAEQFTALLPHLPAEIQAVVRFAYVTGWRIPSEVLILEWRQVDLVAGMVRLDPGTTKNDDGRVFPLTRDLRTVLEAQRIHTDAVSRQLGAIVPLVFHRQGGKPIRDFRGAWATACKAAGCPGRIPHDFRRTAVRNLVRAGVPERVAMQLTGHKTRSVFERYNIVSEGDYRDAANKLNQMTVGTVVGTVGGIEQVSVTRPSL